MKNKYRKIIGENIRKFRNKMGLEQDQLGYLVFGLEPCEKNYNKAQQRITKFETGKKEPSASELYELARVFKVDIKKFFRNHS